MKTKTKKPVGQGSAIQSVNKTQKVSTEPISKPATSSEVKSDVTKKNTKSLAMQHLESFLDKSLFISKARGNQGNDHIFKAGTFDGLSDKEKRSFRRTVRTHLSRFAEAFIAYDGSTSKEDKAKLKQLKESFDKFYSQYFALNDYTLASITGTQVKEEKKAEFEQMFNIIKKIK